MLLVRGLLAVALIVLGAIIVVRILQTAGSGVATLPGVVLGGAMIALGLHRMWLIARARRMM